MKNLTNYSPKTIERMSEAEEKALNILDVEYGHELTAHQFAKKMWPDSKGWNRVTNTGNGATRGKGMWLSGGSYLAKLNNKGLLTHGMSYAMTWRLSIEGRKLLNPK